MVEKVESGSNAAREGEQIVEKMNGSFEKIKEAFGEIDAKVTSELKVIENTSAIFNKIRNEIQSIASISEEHSAASEEMFATMEEQNANIEIIYNLMRNIKDSSENLRNSIKTV
ncbi:MAG TPA: hypothetical protein DCP90_02385 [Clostridiales bacterium]|nr:MAG: hypothetical protein A2Y22_05235 [Clostridiales bacterium GWD2_32_59]HAN09442.1 hypothetical protein [Clostridiales bacterium]